ncbi:MAG: hypothetical protein ACOZNI_02395 [Myxococcota bacterium]
MLLFTLLGCGDTLTNAEAREALEEAVAAAKSEALTGEVVEITTDFTIGEAVEDAAEELRAFLASQVPCSTVTRDGNSVTVDFGTLDDACTYEGRTYAGVVTVTIDRNDDEVVVQHDWEGLTDGEITVDGGATVTWTSVDTITRHVVHELTWTDGERTVVASGDRTQALVDPEQGLAGGIRIDGERAWEGESGAWDLAIDGVQVRPQDPCPEAGVYTLTTPADKVATLTFERVDEDTIRATLTGTRRDLAWEITSAGAIEDAG